MGGHLENTTRERKISTKQRSHISRSISKQEIEVAMDTLRQSEGASPRKICNSVSENAGTGFSFRTWDIYYAIWWI